MLKRDPERLQKLRIAVRYLLREDVMERGHQTRLAEHFNMSRQRVHQVVNDEQQRRARAILIRAARRRQLQQAQAAAASPGASFDAPGAGSA